MNYWQVAASQTREPQHCELKEHGPPNSGKHDAACLQSQGRMQMLQRLQQQQGQQPRKPALA